MSKAQDEQLIEYSKKAVSIISKGIGVATTELYSVFVRHYLVRGVAEAFTGFLLILFSVLSYNTIGLWVILPIIASIVMFYSAILLIGNPKYYAIENIIDNIKELKNRL